MRLRQGAGGCGESTQQGYAAGRTHLHTPTHHTHTHHHPPHTYTPTHHTQTCPAGARQAKHKCPAHKRNAHACLAARSQLVFNPHITFQPSHRLQPDQRAVCRVLKTHPAPPTCVSSATRRRKRRPSKFAGASSGKNPTCRRLVRRCMLCRLDVWPCVCCAARSMPCQLNSTRDEEGATCRPREGECCTKQLWLTAGGATRL